MWMNFKKKTETKLNFYFRNTKKDIIKSEKAEQHFRNTYICRFCEEEEDPNKVRDY